MKKILSFLFFVIGISQAQDLIPQMSHQLVLADEGNGKVHFINTANQSDKWSTTCSNRDLQLIGNNRIMVSDNNGSGYSELDLSTGTVIKHVAVTGINNGINSSFRLSEDVTFCTQDGSPAKIYKVNAVGKILETITLSMDASVRICRPTAKGTFLLGGKTAGMIYEFDSTGKKIWECNAGGEPYMAIRLPDGTTLISNGYGGQIVRADQKGTIIRKFPTETDKKSDPEFWSKARPNFFAGFQILRNGNIVVSNWQGHGTGYGSSGYQLIEIDSAFCKIVAYWKQDALLISSLHHVLVIDDLDTKLLYSDRDGFLQPFSNSVSIIPTHPTLHSPQIQNSNSQKRIVLDMLGRRLAKTSPSVYLVRSMAYHETSSRHVLLHSIKVETSDFASGRVIPSIYCGF
ncbi:MAG TPA: hypothetical protein VHP36_05510 [Chitinispirillaceae bacterium]|nr:hypothetical protein [Chitinispirillaceae bacterium]